MSRSNSKTDVAREFSLWLMPPGQVRRDLAAVISLLSAEYSAPLFPPHVTLLGGLDLPEGELKSRARQVAVQLCPFTLQLGQVDGFEEYFRSLFAHIDMTTPLLEANRVARQVFGRENDPAYMPHLSLLYGNFSPEQKKSIIRRIGTRMNSRFEANRIYLYSTYGDTADWSCLGEFPMAGRD